MRASGAGGQNIQKVETAVQLRFDARQSTRLPDAVRARLEQLAGHRLTNDGVIVITAQRHRTRERNRVDALERLLTLIREAALPPPPKRRPTRPTRGSKERRLDGKSQRSDTKRLRGRPDGDCPATRKHVHEQGNPVSDSVKPAAIVGSMIEAGVIKAALPALDLLVRGLLAGAYLAFVTSMAFLVAAQTGQFVVGALLFPAGFALIVVLGMELLTGNLGILPTALFAGRIGWAAMLRNWGLVFLGNLAGSLLYAVLFWIAATDAGSTTGGVIGDKLGRSRSARPPPTKRSAWPGC